MRLTGRSHRLISTRSRNRGQGYAPARLGLAALAVLGHLTGVLYQKPRIVLALGVLTAVMLWGLVRALRGRASAARVTSKPAPEVAASA